MRKGYKAYIKEGASDWELAAGFYDFEKFKIYVKALEEIFGTANEPNGRLRTNVKI